MNKAIRYEAYPNDEQKVMFAKTFGCCRKIWNLMLSDRNEHYKKTKKSLKTTPAPYKKDYPYLKEVDSLALANVQLHLDKAYKNFFENKKFGFPKFKSAKRCKKSYTTNCVGANLRFEGNGIKLPKVGIVRIKKHREPESNWVIKSATITQENDGRYFISVLFEYETEITSVPVSENAIGLDYTSDGFYTDHNGNVCGSPKYYRKSQKKLAKLQRRLSRKKKGSKNREKAKQKVAKISRHIANQRLDFIHKRSTEIANQYDVVCVETLDMKAMSNKGFGNGKATMDNGYGRFINFLEYKLRDRGKYLVKVDKWYSSSQICCCCGEKHPEMKDLKIRVMDCQCGNHMDRDQNAAVNIRSEGLRLLMSA